MAAGDTRAARHAAGANAEHHETADGNPEEKNGRGMLSTHARGAWQLGRVHREDGSKADPDGIVHAGTSRFHWRYFSDAGGCKELDGLARGDETKGADGQDQDVRTDH